MDAKGEFKERLERAVQKALYHLTASGVDVRELDGSTTIRIKDGELESVQLMSHLAHIHAGETVISRDEAEKYGMATAGDAQPKKPKPKTPA